MTAPPIPVFYINAGAFLGGGERILLEILTGLDRSRFRPQLIALADGPLIDEVKALDVPVIAHPLVLSVLGLSPRRPARAALLLPYALWTLRRAAERVSRELPRTGTAILHADSPKPNLIARWARPPNARSIWHFRSVLTSPWERLAMRGATAPGVTVVANSQATARSLPAGLNARVLYDAVSGGRLGRGWSTVPADSEVPRWPGEFVIGAVAHLAPRKGQDRLLEVMARLRPSRPGVRLVLIGNPVYHSSRDYGAHLRKLARELGVESRVDFVGFGNDVALWLERFDLFVTASCAEGFGLALVEAMLAELPVVASAAGAHPEIVVHGETGYLVPQSDTSAWVEAIARLADDEDLRRRMGRAGRRRALERFGTDRMMNELHELYESLAPRELR